MSPDRRPQIQSLVLFHHLCNSARPRPRPRPRPSPYLTDHLLSEILLRLLAPDVVRFRSVSKRWLSISTHPRFLRSHRRRHLSLSGFFLSPLARNPTYFQLDPSSRPLPTLFLPKSVTVHSLSGDLILYQTKSEPKNQLFLLNLRTWVLAPLPMAQPTQRRRAKDCRHVIISCPSDQTGQFKIVSCNGRTMHVYSSETGAWKQLSHPMTKRPRGVYWAGSLVWAGETSDLFRLDLAEELVETVPWPENKQQAGCQCHYLGESRGRLHLILSSDQRGKLACTQLDVFGMDSLRSGWSVVHRVDLGGIKEVYLELADDRDEFLRMSVVYLYKGGGDRERDDLLFLSIPGRVVSYDLQDKTYTTIDDNVIPQNEGVKHSVGETEYRYFQFHPLEAPSLSSILGVCLVNTVRASIAAGDADDSLLVGKQIIQEFETF